MIPGRNAIWNIVGGDVDACPSIDGADLPGHDHRAGEARVVGFEVHCLVDLFPSGYRMVIIQDQSEERTRLVFNFVGQG